MKAFDVTTTPHPFDRATELTPIDAHTVRGSTQPEWANMVGPFGGITAAVLLAAIQGHEQRLGDPVALTVNYTAPIVDGDFDIALRAARTNRSTQHWVLELSQDDDVKATATAVYGIRRETWGDTELEQVKAPAPETLSSSDYVDVRWAQQYDKRIVEGQVPSDNEPRPSSTTTLWLRDVTGRAIDYPALACACDVFYPRIFLRHGGFKPAGTVSLTTYFHANQDLLDAVGNDFVLGSAQAHRFSYGFFDQSASLWSRAGELLATSHQTVYFKA